MASRVRPNRALTRSSALRILGAAGGGALLAAATRSSCAVTPEGEIGPFFADDSSAGFNRRNIVANLDGTNAQPGIRLTLTIVVRDSRKRCAAVGGAQVDVWHCNARGVYSDEAVENTTGMTWLRGYQITDANGNVTFTTIVPGWYQGRTTHIHLRVRSSYSEASSPTDGKNTTQLFFPQTTIDRIDTSVAPYSSRGSNATTNANDHVYTPETKGSTLVTLSGNVGSGFAASYTVDLPITSS